MNSSKFWRKMQRGERNVEMRKIKEIAAEIGDVHVTNAKYSSWNWEGIRRSRSNGSQKSVPSVSYQQALSDCTLTFLLLHLLMLQLPIILRAPCFLLPCHFAKDWATRGFATNLIFRSLSLAFSYSFSSLIGDRHFLLFLCVYSMSKNEFTKAELFDGAERSGDRKRELLFMVCCTIFCRKKIHVLAILQLESRITQVKSGSGDRLRRRKRR